MSYQLTSHDRNGGLGQGGQPPPAPATTPGDPLWARLTAAFGTPFAQATASRIAHGQTPFYGGGFPSGFAFQSPTGFYGGGAFGGFNPQTILLIAGAGLLAMMLMKR